MNARDQIDASNKEFPGAGGQPTTGERSENARSQARENSDSKREDASESSQPQYAHELLKPSLMKLDAIAKPEGWL